MTDSQEREEEHEGSRPETESPARSPRVSKLPERSHQQAIAALEHDRCSRDCDRRQRIPLRLDIQRWGLPHARLREATGSMPFHASADSGAPVDAAALASLHSIYLIGRATRADDSVLGTVALG
jgi:hypothetical protein